MKTIRAFAIRTTVGGIHHDALYLDEPPKSDLDAKLAKEHELHGEKSAKGDERWVRSQEVGLLVDESKHTWAKNLPDWESPEVVNARASAQESADRLQGKDNQGTMLTPSASGEGRVENKK